MGNYIHEEDYCWMYNTFTSTTMDFEVALDFAQNEHDGMIFEISHRNLFLQNETPFCDISWISIIPGEKEVLFAPCMLDIYAVKFPQHLIQYKDKLINQENSTKIDIIGVEIVGIKNMSDIMNNLKADYRDCKNCDRKNDRSIVNIDQRVTDMRDVAMTTINFGQERKENVSEMNDNFDLKQYLTEHKFTEYEKIQEAIEKQELTMTDILECNENELKEQLQIYKITAVQRNRFVKAIKLLPQSKMHVFS